jgi:hypothetical protein
MTTLARMSGRLPRRLRTLAEQAAAELADPAHGG